MRQVGIEHLHRRVVGVNDLRGADALRQQFDTVGRTARPPAPPSDRACCAAVRRRAVRRRLPGDTAASDRYTCRRRSSRTVPVPAIPCRLAAAAAGPRHVLLAVAAGVLVPHVLDHLQCSGNEFQLLARVAADPLPLVAAAGTDFSAGARSCSTISRGRWSGNEFLPPPRRRCSRTTVSDGAAGPDGQMVAKRLVIEAPPQAIGRYVPSQKSLARGLLACVDNLGRRTIRHCE